ncbi:MBL fold metallo-hydrolase [Tengunoibacter tsumagoiensis]|uniref:Metallo-beta-lactamase domain-containing protein n=1 Tax=Tengunoibacter tsumagoiensis TaxID=2014871 RepID=A0A402A6Z2_9CHLR|nr:MBL fold metallo-hydrolase [Tengunoibacter tsumagoiensis]GCE14796.1 hypothetical protein KTT_46550 [Tengunoibacter tsumagoiensis]
MHVHSIHSPYFRIEQVAEGVYAAIVVEGMGAWGNAGIINLGQQTLVFDTFFTPVAAQDLRQAAELLTGRAPRYVVNSHFHADHTFGNQVFQDALLISSQQVSTLMKTFLPRELEELNESRHYFEQGLAKSHDPRLRKDWALLAREYQALAAAAPTLQIRYPDLTFKESLTIHGTAYTAELISFVGGHTPGDTVLYLPECKTLFAGDLVQVAFHPSSNRANISAWYRHLDHLATLTIKQLVPGHGNVGSAEHIQIQSQYWHDIQAIAQKLKQSSGLTEPVIQEPEPYQSWSSPTLFQQNVRNAMNWS